MPVPEILITAPVVKWLELDFGESVTILPNACSFADVDNDGVSEFVAGSISGELFIFKSISAKYWKKSTEQLGMITAVGAGDIMRKKKNIMYAVTGEGNLYTFALSASHALPKDFELESTGKLKDHSSARNRNIDYLTHQTIPPNIVMSVLADIDGDGFPEILFGMTDRVVRSFKWVELSNGPGGITGAFTTMNKWEFSGQIGNLSSTTFNGAAEIFVSQPGGCCCRLKTALSSAQPNAEIAFEPPVYHSSSVTRTRNNSMQTHVLAGISFTDQEPAFVTTEAVPVKYEKDIYAMCNFDGSLIVCHEDTVLWEFQTSENLITIQPLPFRDEFVLAAGSGAVYVVNRNKKMVKLLLAEPMSGFAVGSYGSVTRPTENINTCAFATISGPKVLIYHDLDIPSNLDKLGSLWRRPVLKQRA
ncbi:hypothetical protein RvY_07711 [Ramazzottius varieornatus]|uniref:Uncharacterized protein n=1 Tax=Ramazzottius varieornatus TaxID=947166 RepID=A0A1D1V5U8_RAMVA|nr:hypothetical protein RvY_07711 [Ramazzottius varieornatus]